jgi:hypothetical protein
LQSEKKGAVAPVFLGYGLWSIGLLCPDEETVAIIGMNFRSCPITRLSMFR